MNVRDLFAYGPWRLPLIAWVCGAIITAVWLAWPIVRISAVTSPELAGTLFGALAGIAAAIARARYFRRRGAGIVLVIAFMAAGAAAGVAGAYSLFRPIVARGCDCAPLLASHESRSGQLVSYIVPVLTLLAWCGWIFAGIAARTGLEGGRVNDYATFVSRVLPFRVVVTIVVLAGAALFIRTGVMVPEELGPGEILERMRGAGASSIAVAHSSSYVEKLERIRQARRVDALERLAALDLDGARALVHDAACALVLPGTKPEEDIAAAEEAFSKLDREIDYEFSTWRPSAISGRALFELLPMVVDGDTVQLPLMWGEPATEAATITTGRVEGRYRQRKVIDALIVAAVAPSRSFNAGVAMKLLGTSGIDARLPEILSRRLGRAPTGGVTTTGAGAMCAMWDFQDLKLRLGPAVDPNAPLPTPSAPIWLTYYRSSVTDRYRSSNLLPPELAATYDCGALQVQSH
jgi:hypothetical protein